MSLLGSCAFRLLWIYLIFPLCPTLWMVYLSYPISWALTALIHFTVSMAVRRRYMRMYPEDIPDAEEKNSPGFPIRESRGFSYVRYIRFSTDSANATADGLSGEPSP